MQSSCLRKEIDDRLSNIGLLSEKIMVEVIHVLYYIDSLNNHCRGEI